MKSILVVTKDPEVFRILRGGFHSGYRVGVAAGKDAALEALHKKRYDFIFVDIDMIREPGADNGYRLIFQPFWHLYPTVEIIVMAAPEMIREAVMAVKAGASNYITYPVNLDEARYVVESIERSVIVQSELDYLRKRLIESDSQEVFQTGSPLMQSVFDKVRSVAPTRSTVLLIGETGTGKGVVAKLIHRLSNRRDAQFISVHCGAIPDTLVESELFGHEKGAFTGAVRRKLGKFEIASGGTIFLDEIGTITPSAQIKLLQVLQDGTFQRVGGEDTIETNLRVIAATNTDLKAMCGEGSFRKDLYYRLNVFPIEIPSLRDRIEDIPLFVEAFLKKLNRYSSKEVKGVQAEAMQAFRDYPWPGNIRELENLVERAYILETEPVLTRENFPGELFEIVHPAAALPVDSLNTLEWVRRKGIEEIEKRYLVDLLGKKRGKIKEAAASAGISTRQLHKLMAKYGIRKEAFKSFASGTAKTH